MQNIVPFESSAVPAFLQNTAATNDDLDAHAVSSFSVMSIKGKVFTLVKDGERRRVPNPKDPSSPASNIDVIVLRVSPFTSKSYYATGFSENAEDQKPACFSYDGVRPDPSIEHPQCATCAACKWNAFGTARGDNGGLGRGKACADSIRMAIADPTNIDEPIFLRLPPLSMRSLGEYSNTLKRHKAPYQGVLTNIAFDQDLATPRLLFRPVGFLQDQAQFNHVLEVAEGEQVHRMLFGDLPREIVEERIACKKSGKPAPKPAPEVQAAPATLAAPVVPAPPMAQAAPAPANKREADADDIIAQAMGVASEAPAKASTASVVSDGTLDDALNSLGFD